MKEKLSTGILIAIAILLLLNLFQSNHPIMTMDAEAQGMPGSKANGVAIACSEDGSKVYIAFSDKQEVYRSAKYGEAGSWEHIAY